jgi:hypothetical protein
MQQVMLIGNVFIEVTLYIPKQMLFLQLVMHSMKREIFYGQTNLIRRK